jgi:hypothetical protein
LKKGPQLRLCGALLTSAFVFISLFAFSHLSPAGAEEDDLLDVIDRANREGRLDEETALVYRVWAALDPDRLPADLAARPRRFLKSLTPLLLEVRARWPRLSPVTRSLLAPYLLRPTESDQEPFLYGHSYEVSALYHDSPGGHFRIWYVTSTDDAPQLNYSHGDSIPDWIHLCAQVFDHVWEQQVDSLGYRPPPADGPWYGQEDYGGDTRYDVYVENLNRHLVYGYTQSEFFISGDNPRAATSYLVVDNDYAGIYPSAGEAGLMVTAAHEFFHAIQFAYDTLEERFFMEISSTWMEDVVYDDIDDYLYYIAHSGSIFNHPERSLTTFDGIHEYSACVWGHYLADRFDPGIVREIWEGCVHDAVLNATEDVLHARGSGLSEALNEFAVWNYFTGPLADTARFYPEGHRYPQVKVYDAQVHTQFPAVAGSVAAFPEPLGAGYARFIPPGGASALSVEVEGDPAVLWKASLLGVGPPHEVIPFSLDGFGRGQAWLAGWGDTQEAVLVMTPFAYTTSGVPFGYQARSDTTAPQPPQVTTALGQNYPNPAAGERVVIPFSLAREAPVTLRIFTLDGQPVRAFNWGRLEAGEYFGPDPASGDWDLTNASGEPVAAGVYFYQLQAGDFIEMRKMAVVR